MRWEPFGDPLSQWCHLSLFPKLVWNGASKVLSCYSAFYLAFQSLDQLQADGEAGLE